MKFSNISELSSILPILPNIGPWCIGEAWGRPTTLKPVEHVICSHICFIGCLSLFAVYDRQWLMDHEPWTTYLGPWTMASGPWTLAPPRSCALGVHAGHSTCILVVEFRRVASWTEGCYITYIQYMCICDIYHIYIHTAYITFIYVGIQIFILELWPRLQSSPNRHILHSTDPSGRGGFSY